MSETQATVHGLQCLLEGPAPPPALCAHVKGAPPRGALLGWPTPVWAAVAAPGTPGLGPLSAVREGWAGAELGEPRSVSHQGIWGYRWWSHRVLLTFSTGGQEAEPSAAGGTILGHRGWSCPTCPGGGWSRSAQSRPGRLLRPIGKAGCLGPAPAHEPAGTSGLGPRCPGLPAQRKCCPARRPCPHAATELVRETQARVTRRKEEGDPGSSPRSSHNPALQQVGEPRVQ